jgi:hypothetical protein
MGTVVYRRERDFDRDRFHRAPVIGDRFRPAAKGAERRKRPSRLNISEVRPFAIAT